MNTIKVTTSNATTGENTISSNEYVKYTNTTANTISSNGSVTYSSIFDDCIEKFRVIPSTIPLPPNINIKDVEIYNERVILVRFTDGTWTKSVCSENDIFDLDVGITICLIKKLLGGQKKGTKQYMKFLKKAHKVMDDKKKEEEKKKEDELIRRNKKKKAEMKRKAKALKSKEEQIDIIRHGIARALRESGEL